MCNHNFGIIAITSKITEKATESTPARRTQGVSCKWLEESPVDFSMLHDALEHWGIMSLSAKFRHVGNLGIWFDPNCVCPLNEVASCICAEKIYGNAVVVVDLGDFDEQFALNPEQIETLTKYAEGFLQCSKENYIVPFVEAFAIDDDHMKASFDFTWRLMLEDILGTEVETE